jgi:type I restriction enzyme M protein
LSDLQEFITLYNPENRHKREETWHPDKNPEGRWRKFSYKEITDRDKASLDISWLKDANLTNLDNLPEPEALAEEIVETIEAALVSFREVASELNGDPKDLP